MYLLILQRWQKSDLLIGIELNILESMHIYFMILSTCQIWRLHYMIIFINKDDYMKLHGQTKRISKGKPFKLTFNNQYFSYMMYLLIADFYILTFLFHFTWAHQMERVQGKQNSLIKIAHGRMQALFQFEIRAVFIQACTANKL